MAKTPPLTLEPLENETNQLFLTLVAFKKVNYLTIVNNVVDDEIQVFVLDSLSAEGISQEWFMSVAVRWFYGASERYPLSFEFAKLDRGDVTRKVLKSFNISSTSRVIGRLFTYPLNEKPKVKRRKAQFVQEMNEIKLRKA